MSVNNVKIKTQNEEHMYALIKVVSVCINNNFDEVRSYIIHKLIIN